MVWLVPEELLEQMVQMVRMAAREKKETKEPKEMLELLVIKAPQDEMVCLHLEEQMGEMAQMVIMVVK